MFLALPGTYALVLRCRAARTARIGSLNRLRLQPACSHRPPQPQGQPARTGNIDY